MRDPFKLVTHAKNFSERAVGWMEALRKRRLEAQITYGKEKAKKVKKGGAKGRKTKKQAEDEKLLAAIANFRKK